jgi:hypothetical protein
MGKSSQGGSSTQTTKAQPPDYALPGLTELSGAALDNFRTGPAPYYPGSTVTNQAGSTLDAMGAIDQRARNGNPLLDTAQGNADYALNGGYMNNGSMQGLMGMGLDNIGTHLPGQGTLASIGSGSMLNANPYVDDMFRQASDQVGQQFSKYVMPGVSSMFEGAGRYGSNAHDEGIRGATSSFGSTLNDLATKIYGGNYANERGLQQQALGQLGSQGLAGRGLQQQAFGEYGTQFGRERALQTQLAGMAPGLAQADYFDLNQLMGLGQQQEAYNQQNIDAAKQRFDFTQQAPEQQLAFLNQILSGAAEYKGTTKDTSSTVPRNPVMSALGGGLSGAALGTQIGAGFGPIGALGGALLGGLFG